MPNKLIAIVAIVFLVFSCAIGKDDDNKRRIMGIKEKVMAKRV